MRIFIIGFMGSGKTTFGRKLAKKLGYRFADTDKLLEHKFAMTIADFFEKHGQKKFRQQEHKLLLELIADDNIVIATGGGFPCFSGNMDIINEAGVSVYIQLSAAALFSRLSGSRATRPLIRDLDGDELLAYISNELQMREAFYLKAKIVAGGLNITPEVVTGMLKHFG